jgi:hypothetical protein
VAAPGTQILSTWIYRNYKGQYYVSADGTAWHPVWAGSRAAEVQRPWQGGQQQEGDASGLLSSAQPAPAPAPWRQTTGSAQGLVPLGLFVLG